MGTECKCYILSYIPVRLSAFRKRRAMFSQTTEITQNGPTGSLIPTGRYIMLLTDHKAPKKDLGQVRNLCGDTGVDSKE